MKIWNGYGSEHSMRLVMIGHFKTARDAETAKELIDRLTDRANVEYAERDLEEDRERRFSDELLNLLRNSELYSMGSVEFEQFTYDVQVRLQGKDVVVTTQEIEVSAFLKVLVDRGARVEVYSGHHYPPSDEGHDG